MSLKRRLERLEGRQGPADDGRCPACRDRPERATVTVVGDLDGPAHDPEPCPVCGWAPTVVTVIRLPENHR